MPPLSLFLQDSTFCEYPFLSYILFRSRKPRRWRDHKCGLCVICPEQPRTRHQAARKKTGLLPLLRSPLPGATRPSTCEPGGFPWASPPPAVPAAGGHRKTLNVPDTTAKSQIT